MFQHFHEPVAIRRPRASLSEQLIQTMSHAVERRRREEPERIAEAQYLGILA